LNKRNLPVIAAILIIAFFAFNVIGDLILYFQKNTIIHVFWAALFMALMVPFIIFLLYVLEGYLYKRKIKESIKSVSPKNNQEKQGKTD
jgi:membrane protein implicated in regulation of membrane protease activity